MVGVDVGDADSPQPAEAPPGLAPGNLRTLSAIEERQMAVDPDNERREPATGQWKHPARSQEHGVNHGERPSMPEGTTVKS
jgi:hypothetical protein